MRATSRNTTHPSGSAPQAPTAALLFVAAAPIQIGRSLELVIDRLRLPIQERALRRASRLLGREMQRAGVGDQLLRERLTQLESAPGQSSQATCAEAEERLGRSALGVDVPVIGAELPYRQARRAHDALDRNRNRIDKLTAQLAPSTALGWIQLGVSYLGLAILVSVAVVALRSIWAGGLKPTGHTGPAILRVRLASVDVRVDSARVAYDVAPADVVTDHRPRHNQSVFTINLEIANQGAQPVHYVSWRGQSSARKRDFATLVDSRGEELLLTSFVRSGDLAPQGGVAEATIPPGQSIRDVLMFSLPADGTKHLDLFLPGDNLGLNAEETASIRIPRSFFAATVDSGAAKQ
jgi:hypothetical protein